MEYKERVGFDSLPSLYGLRRQTSIKTKTLSYKKSSFNVILLEKTDLSIAIEAKGILPSMSF